MKYGVIGLFILIIYNSIAIAETTNFRQQVLPIDCIYEVINVGTQQLRYITPETCPIDPGPPIVTEPSVDEPINYPVATSGVVQTNWRYRPQVSIAKPPSILPPSSQAEPTDNQTVQGTVERIDRIIVNNRDALVMIILASIGVFLFYFVVVRRYINRVI